MRENLCGGVVFLIIAGIDCSLAIILKRNKTRETDLSDSRWKVWKVNKTLGKNGLTK